MKKAFFERYQYGKEYLFSDTANAQILNSINSIMKETLLSEDAQYEKIELILKSNHYLDLNPKGYDSKLPLFQACATNSIEIAKLLIRFGARVDAVDDEKNSLLMIAISQCHDYNLRVKSNSYLQDTIHAIFNLISIGSNINHKNSNEETPLQLAICLNVPIVPFLLEKGAKLNLSKLRVSNSNRCLYFAINNGDIFILRLLLERNASATTGLYYLLNKISFVNFNKKRAHELFFLLLEFGANINQLQLLVNEYETNNAINLSIRFSLIRLMLDNGAARRLNISIDEDMPEYLKEHNDKIMNLIVDHKAIPSLKQLCVMNFFNNPKQLPLDIELPKDISDSVKGIGEEPDTSTLFYPKASGMMCVIQ